MKAHKKALSTKSTDGDLSAIAEANNLLAQAEEEAKQYSKRYDTQSEKMMQMFYVKSDKMKRG